MSARRSSKPQPKARDIAVSLSLSEASLLKNAVDAAVDGGVKWMRPMDLGGRDASRHSYLLAKMTRAGLFDRRLRNTLLNAIGGGRGSYVYRPTKLGKAVVRAF